MTQFIEIHVAERFGFNPGSQFGHVAIEIDGIVYSRAPSKYHTEYYDDYLRRNASFRSAVGLRLHVTMYEKLMIRSELERRVHDNHPYSALSNSCSSNVAEVLEMIGIAGRDPRYFATPVTPAELRAAVMKSNRLTELRRYPKGSLGGGASGN